MSLGGKLDQIVSPQLPAALKTAVDRIIGEGAAFGQQITIRRGSTTLDPQNVRIVSGAAVPAARKESTGAQQFEGVYTVMGDIDLNIASGDRFTHDGQLYEVTAVRPNRQYSTVASARMVQ